METFWKWSTHDNHVISLPEFSSNTNRKWLVVVSFFNSFGVAWTKNIWRVVRVKTPFSNSACVVCTGPDTTWGGGGLWLGYKRDGGARRTFQGVIPLRVFGLKRSHDRRFRGGGGGCDSDIKGMGVLVVPFRVSYLLRCSASKGPTTGDFVGWQLIGGFGTGIS